MSSVGGQNKRHFQRPTGDKNICAAILLLLLLLLLLI